MWKELFSLIKEVFQSFTRENAPKSAAAMAYYTLFSLFPLLIVMVTVISYFVNAQATSEQVSQVLMGAIPVSQALVERNIHRVLEVRNSVGAVGLIGFLWSSSSAFYLLVDSINRAWSKQDRRPFFQKRLFGLAFVVILIILLVIFMFSSSLFNILVRYQPDWLHLGDFLGLDLASLAASSVNWIAPFLFFLSLYSWVPPRHVPWKYSLSISGLITVVWRLASSLFKWYLGSGFSRYELVFGSLSAIVVMLFWIYISSVIIFFGGHLVAVLSKRGERGAGTS